MRPSCLYCARKHLAQAEVLMCEALNGYPAHMWLAVGHMAEAEHELLETFPDMCHEIREHRVEYMTEVGYKVPTMDLIEKITDIEMSLGDEEVYDTSSSSGE